METNITPGIIILLVGICLLYWVVRRRCNRRRPSGMEHFSSYGRALVIVVIERVAKVLGWVLIVCGLLWFLYVWQVGRGRGRWRTGLGCAWSRWGSIILDNVSCCSMTMAGQLHLKG